MSGVTTAGPPAPPPYGYPPPPYGYPPPAYVPPPPAVSPAGAPLAEFDKRLIAHLVDVAILVAAQLVIIVPLVIGLALTVPQAVVDPQTGRLGNSSVLVAGWFALIFITALASVAVSLLFGYLYYVEFSLQQGGQTVGKRLAKIRIVPLNPAESLTRRHLALRYLSYYGMSLVSVLGWIDGLWQLWDKPYRQCLHDKAAKTVVVRLDA